MNKLFLSTALISSIIFTSCSTNSALNNFKDKSLNVNALEFTKKKDYIKNNEPKILYIGTYLNKIEKEFDNKNENFLIGLYFTDGETQNFLKRGYKIVLNDKDFLKLEKIDKNHKVLKTIPLKNPWAKYYIISFEKTKLTTLKLSLLKDKLNIMNIDYQK